MSWLKEVFDFSNENKDPVLKWLIRLTFSVVFIVLVFFAYNIITGRCVEIAGCRFCVIEQDSIKIIQSTKADTLTKVDKTKLVPNRNNSRDSNLNLAQTIKSKTNQVSPESASDSLTLHDEKKIDKILTEFVGVYDKATTPIIINYNDSYKGVVECAFDLKAFLTSKGYYVESVKSIDSHSNDFGVTVPNFVLTYSTSTNPVGKIIIQIGELSPNDNDRTFQIKTD